MTVSQRVAKYFMILQKRHFFRYKIEILTVCEFQKIKLKIFVRNLRNFKISLFWENLLFRLTNAENSVCFFIQAFKEEREKWPEATAFRQNFRIKKKAEKVESQKAYQNLSHDQIRRKSWFSTNNYVSAPKIHLIDIRIYRIPGYPLFIFRKIAQLIFNLEKNERGHEVKKKSSDCKNCRTACITLFEQLTLASG